jgi:sulfite exporter TauE/SafE
MTYQPYPTGSGSNEAAGIAERPPRPPALRNAVRLMWVGAVLALVSAISTLAFSSKIRSAVIKAAVKANATRRSDGKTVLTNSQIHSLASATVIVLAVGGIIAVLLWAWMAWANSKGSRWARIVATVLFALNTISLIFAFGRASITIIFVALGWLVGLAAVVLLWRKETTAYVRPRVQ